MSSHGESSHAREHLNLSPVQHSASPSTNLTTPAVTRFQYLMNDIPRGTSRIKLVNYLLAPPHWTHKATTQPGILHPQVQFACTITDSRLDDEQSVATVEFTQTPEWLNLLNDDPTGFPKKTLLGTLWRGVDTTTLDSDGRTEFMRAAMADNLLYAEALAEFTSTDINVQDLQGRTALHWACVNHLPNIVMLCLSVPGCDVGLRDRDNLTAFDLSLSGPDDLIPNLFYHSMFELEEQDPQAALLRVLTVSSAPAEDMPVFPGAAMFDPAQAGNTALVEALITRGVDLAATNSDGETALHLAAAKVGNVDVVRMLLEAGSDVGAAATGGATALNHAADEETVEALQQWIAGFETRGTDNTAHSAAEAGNGNSGDFAGTEKDLAHYLEGEETDTVIHPTIPLLHEIEARDVEAGTVLLQRVRDGDLDAVLDFIKRGGNLEARDENGRTALHLAVIGRQAQIITALLTNGANTEAAEEDGWTALHLAAVDGHTEAVTALLANGANKETASNDGDRALQLAAQNGHDATVSILLRNGANTEAAEEDGWTALHYAAMDGHTDAVMVLLTNGANIEGATKGGRTALHMAAKYGHTEMITTLLTNGANIGAVTKNGQTTMHIAARNGHTETVTALLANEANIEAVEKYDWTALHFAVTNGHTDTVTALLTNEANIEAAATDGRRALHIAAANGYREIVTRLLANGANTEATDMHGWTALHYAAANGNTETVTTLQTNGANKKAATENGGRALHLAAEYGHPETVTVLLASGAEIEAKRIDEQTALHMAARLGRLEVVRILLREGASLEACSLDATTLEMAVFGGHTDVAELLVAHGARRTRPRRIGYHTRHQLGLTD